MEEILSCQYNMDTACVEVVYMGGILLAIDTIAVENEVAGTMYDRSELDWLIYNKPWEYVSLVLSGELECYLTHGYEHRLAD